MLLPLLSVGKDELWIGGKAGVNISFRAMLPFYFRIRRHIVGVLSILAAREKESVLCGEMKCVSQQHVYN